MAELKALIVPENWKNELWEKFQKTGAKNSFLLQTIPPPSNHKAIAISKLLFQIHQQHQVHCFLLLLPKSYCHHARLPKFIYHHQGVFLFLSIQFTATPREWFSEFSKATVPTSHTHKKIHLSCQYQIPYTQIFEFAQLKSGEHFHPGDYFKGDFLNALAKMHGTWIYWGHADLEKLRGYEELYEKDLITALKNKKLQGCIWMGCKTLSLHPNSIALNFHLAQKSKFILASKKEIQSSDNEHLCKALLQNIQKSTNSGIINILQSMLTQDPENIYPVLKNYQLLGNPWALVN